MTKSGIMYEITCGNINILNNLRNGIIDSTDGLIKHFENKSKGYYLNKYRTVDRYYDNNEKMFKAKVTVTNGPYLRFVKGTTRSFKKKKNRWNRYDTNISARVYGAIYIKDSYGDYTFNGNTDSGIATDDDSYVIAKRSLRYKFYARSSYLHCACTCNGESYTVTLN